MAVIVSSAGARLLRIREPAPLRWTAAPREVALRIACRRYGDALEDTGTDSPAAFDLADFQRDAVRRAEAILARRGGVVLADSVGLGKTYVALAIIEAAVRRGARVAVITPAALASGWRRNLRRLAGLLGVGSTRGLGGVGAGGGAAPELAIPESDAPDAADRRGHRIRAADAADAMVCWLSHARLSRGTHEPERLRPLGLVVIDEAHAFRNPRTHRYRALADLCRGARVLLITATPVNNSVLDLYALIRLFAAEDAFHDLGVPEMRAAFQAADGEESVASALGPLLRAVVVRRTRPFILDRHGPVRLPGTAPGRSAFPDRASPVPVRYGLDETWRDLHRPVPELIEQLGFAALEYAEEARSGTTAPSELLRLLLLKRLESSVAAFLATVRRQQRFHEAFIAALDRGRLLVPADHRSLYRSSDDGDAMQLILDAVALRSVPDELDRSAIADAVRGDLDTLALLERWAGAVQSVSDPKLFRLFELLDEEIGRDKVVIFTEARETARYLWRRLVRRRPVGLIDGRGAFLGLGAAARGEVIRRFAPRANGVREPHARERIDVLIATDVLAEGLDLHDARRVISYDLPWNPVRLVQRIGRVDRLGSRFDVVHSYHFLATGALDGALRLNERLRRKLTSIGRSVGLERPVLDRLAAGDPELFDDIERADARPFELAEAVGRAIAASGREERRRAATASTAPVAIARRHDSPGPERPTLLAAFSVGAMDLWLVVRSDGRIIDDEAEALELLLLAFDAGAAPDSWPCRAGIEDALWAARIEAERRAAFGPTSAPPAPNSPAARAARRLLEALASMPGGPAPELCDRADLLLNRLGRRPPAGVELEIERALRAVEPMSTARAAPALVRALESALDPDRDSAARVRPFSGPSEAPHPPRNRPVRLVGVIAFRPGLNG